MTQRTEQIATAIRRALQEALSRGLNDPRVRGLVSVVKVTVTDDLAEAVAHISVLPAENGPLTLKGLAHAAGHLQGRLARAANLRRVPRLRFALDESMRRAAELDVALGAASADGIGAPPAEPAEHATEHADGPAIAPANGEEENP